MAIKFKRNYQPRKEHMVDNDIPFNTFFLINQEGEKVGLVKKQEALSLAREQKLNVVIISSNTNPPVGKILDYGKFKYSRKKKQKEVKSKQTIIENREVRLTSFIGEHDLKTKANKVKDFIKQGDRVKVSLKFRGREILHPELGKQKLLHFFSLVEDVCEIQKEPILNNRFYDMYLFKKSNKSVKEKTNAKIQTKEITPKED
ncbi:MAG: translation initiation factor IF-3 [Mycoplasma sp.]|nr:translation initiation factor IF-3 [Mycoplasma sp.]